MNWPPDLKDITPYLGVRCSIPFVPLSSPNIYFSFLALRRCHRPARQRRAHLLDRMPRPRAPIPDEPKVAERGDAHARRACAHPDALLRGRPGLHLQLHGRRGDDPRDGVEWRKGAGHGADAGLEREWDGCGDVG